MAALFTIPSALSKYMCKKVSSLQRRNYYRNVVVFELLVSCVLPLCVVAITYIMTAHHLVESSRSIPDGKQIPQLNTTRNTAKILLALTVVFLISYVPYHAFWTYINYTAKDVHFQTHKITEILGHSNYKIQYMYLISSSFLLINPCLNPVALFCTIFFFVFGVYD